jgi:arylformamidase
MAGIDYETEYMPSTGVPDYLEILASWERDAAAYRANARAALGVAYGDTPRQAMDIFLPEGDRLAMFIHGGWWRMLDRASFSHMARGLNAHGVAVAVVSHDLCPAVSIATIVEQIRRACLFLGRPLTVIGHSAGGHLAAMAAATLSEVVGGTAISGAFDLLPLLNVSENADWRLDAASARALSPIHLPPPAVFDAVVGERESGEFRRQSRALSDAWGARYGEIAGANHFTVLDGLCDPASAMVARIVEICAGNTR